MSPAEFTPSQNTDNPLLNGSPAFGGDLTNAGQDILGLPQSHGPQSLLSPDYLLRDTENGSQEGNDTLASSDALLGGVPSDNRYIQPVYGDELITNIPPIDAVIDKIAQVHDTISNAQEDLVETLKPKLEEIRQDLTSLTNQALTTAAESWNSPDNQTRALVDESVGNIRNAWNSFIESDRFQTGLQNSRSFLQNLWQNVRERVEDFQAVAVPVVEDFVGRLAGEVSPSLPSGGTAIPANSVEFRGQVYVWGAYTIKFGDTLSQIAQDTLGDASPDAYNFIAQHNGITNPDVIDAGKQIEIPYLLANQPQLQPVISASPVIPAIESTSEVINGFEVSGEFLRVFREGDFGTPASGVNTHSSGARFQFFDDPDLGRMSIVQSEHGTYPLYGGVRSYYVNVTNGLNGPLGAPTSGEQPIGDGQVRQKFENGYILWQDGVAQGFHLDESPLFPAPSNSSPATSAVPSTYQGAITTAVGADYFLARPEFYTTGNIFAQSGYGSSLVNGTGSTQGNCTWYAHGRALEMGGDPAALGSMSGNANEWHTQLSNGARVIDSGELPQPGDIAQWTRNGQNHVAVVEEVYQAGDGQWRIKISESHYFGEGNGILHSVKDYSADNPDRFIRVPGVRTEPAVIEAPLDVVESQPYPETIEAPLDVVESQPYLEVEPISGETTYSPASSIVNVNNTLYRHPIPNELTDFIWNGVRNLFGANIETEQQYILITSGSLIIEHLEQHANSDGSLTVRMDIRNPHGIDAFVEIYDHNGSRLVDILDQQIEANASPESLFEGAHDMFRTAASGELNFGFSDIRNFTTPTTIELTLQPGQSMDLSVNSLPTVIHNTFQLIIDTISFANDVSGSISQRLSGGNKETFLNQLSNKLTMLLQEEKFETISAGLIEAIKASQSPEEYLSSQAIVDFINYIFTDVMMDFILTDATEMSDVLDPGNYDGLAMSYAEDYADDLVKKLSMGVGIFAEVTFHVSKAANIYQRFSDMKSALEAENLHSATFEVR